MAGFWTGLVHGTLMCGTTLAALSLAFPRDAGREDIAALDRAPEASPASVPARVAPPAASVLEAPADSMDPEAAPVQPGPAPVLSPPQDEAVPVPAADPAASPAASATAPASAAAAASGEDASGPAERLPDPIGSDFRRGSDDPPRVPAVSPAPVERHVPRSVAASEEAVPPPALMPGEMPPVSTVPDAPGLRTPEPFEPEPLGLPLDEPAVTIAAPGRAEVPGLDRRPEAGAPDAAVRALPVAAEDRADDSQAASAAAAKGDDAGDATGRPNGTALAEPQAGAVDADASSRIPDAADGDAVSRAATNPSTADTNPNPQAAADQRAPAAAAPEDPAAAWLPRPAPDLSIPRALLAPGSGRRAPALPQPAAATPPGPDLSDINPGASR